MKSFGSYVHCGVFSKVLDNRKHEQLVVEGTLPLDCQGDAVKRGIRNNGITCNGLEMKML